MPQPDLYTLPLLRWIALHRTATTHQVITVFWLLAGRNTRHGYTVIRRLIARGLLSSEPVERAHGAASTHALRLTRAGWRALGIEPSARLLRADPALREYRLQSAEMMLVRDNEGWRQVRPERAWEAYRDWLVSPYRGRMLNDLERLEKRSIERLPTQTIPLQVLRHRESREIRLLLPVRQGTSYSRLLASIPHVILRDRVAFEIVCAELSLLETAEAVIQRWARRRKVKAELHRVPHYRTRAHPGRVAEDLQDHYASCGMKDPRDRWRR